MIMTMKELSATDLDKCVNWDKQDFYVSKLTSQILMGGSDKYILVPDADHDEAMKVLGKQQ